MLRARSLFLPICALMLATAGSAGAQEFRATVKGQVADTSDAALPGATVTVQNQDTNEIATAVTNTEGAYTLPFLRPGLYTLTVELSGFQKNIRKDMRLEVGQVATVNVQLGVGADRDGERLVRSAAARDQPRRPRPGHRQRPHRRAAAAVAQPDGARRARRRRELQRPGHLPAPLRQRRARRLVDERRPEPQQRVPARRRPNNANQGGNNIAYVPPADAVQEFKVVDQLLRRAVRPDRRRRGQHVAEVRHQRASWRRLRVLPPQVARRELVPAERAQRAEDRPLSRSVRPASRSIGPGLHGRNKTFFMFTGEKYREGTPAPLFSTVPTDAMKRGDFSGLVDAQGRLIRSTTRRPGATSTACGRAIRSRATSSRPTASTRRRGHHGVLPVAERHDGRRRAVAAEPALRRALQQGPVLELGQQGRSQLRHERPHLLPLGRERAQRGAQHQRRSAPARPRTASCR